MWRIVDTSYVGLELKVSISTQIAGVGLDRKKQEAESTSME